MRDRIRPVSASPYLHLFVATAIVLGGCDPATPRSGQTEPTDASVDRIILMAAAGGAGCMATAHDGGTELGDGGGGGGGGTVSVSVDAGVGAMGGMRAAEGGKAGAPAGGRGGGGGVAPAGRGGVGGTPTSLPGSGGAAGGGGEGMAGSAGAAGAAGQPGAGGLGGAAGAAGAGGLGGGGQGGQGGDGGVGGGASGGQGGFGGTVSSAPPPNPGELAIVELLINPAGTDTGREWVEVVNRASHALDLSSLHIADAANDAAIDFNVAGSSILAAGERAVLIQSADVTKNGGVALTTTFGGSFGTRVSLNNDADTITVCAGACATGVMIDQLSWDSSLGTTYDDHALSIDDGGRRCPATAPFGDAGSFGTPGAANPPCP
ncbi:MAG TPA: lamin tail domain-containing protein [Polyangia bacterium]|jgi:hypothetical protein